jgi:segregation and condensation protein A
LDYQVRISNFEGPFDLLFHLIEKSEMNIYDIPIAEITSQYLEYIYDIGNLDLDNASEFIVMAATLLEIKSKMLLPKDPSFEDEASSDLDDPRAELVQKLIEYKKYKDISMMLKPMEEKRINVVYKNAEIIDDIKEDKLLLNITLEDIKEAFNAIVKRRAEEKSINEGLEQELMQEEFTVDDKIDDIRRFIRCNKSTVFSELIAGSKNKFEIIITFLAMLELIKLREITVYQNSIYGDIIIDQC